jgi:uncharacterized Zn ribbon protein
MGNDFSDHTCPECEECTLAYYYDKWGDPDTLWCPCCNAEFDTMAFCSQSGGADDG